MSVKPIFQCLFIKEKTMQTRISLMSIVFALVVLLVGTSSVLAQDISCTVCHDDTTLITGKKTGWSESMHGTGEAFWRGTSAGCAGCHSGGGFSAMVAQGLTPETVEAGIPIRPARTAAPATRFTPATPKRTGLWRPPPRCRSSLLIR